MRLARLTDQISDNFNINKNTGLALLDVEKTFDTVSQKSMIYKMIHTKFHISLVILVFDYLR